MNWRRSITPWRLAALALGLLALLIWPPVRHALEASMTRHMLLQFPLLMLVGAMLSAALPHQAVRALGRWNAHGVAGLVGVAVVLALAMIPRLLDLVLVNDTLEWIKFAMLVLAGAALRLSWQPAGLLVQGFFLGNVLPMGIVVGQVFVDSPVRICNAYLLDDQVRLGQWLTWSCAIFAAAWLVQVARLLIRREHAALLAQEHT